MLGGAVGVLVGGVVVVVVGVLVGGTGVFVAVGLGVFVTSGPHDVTIAVSRGVEGVIVGTPAIAGCHIKMSDTPR